MAFELVMPRDRWSTGVACRGRQPGEAWRTPAQPVGLALALVLVAASHGVAAELPETTLGSRPPVPERVASDRADAKTLPVLELSWWSVDGGGGTSSGGIYTVTGTVGQPDAGTSTSCWLAVDGGLWSQAVDGGSPLFCDGFETGDTSRWSSVTPAGKAEAGGGTR